MKISEKGNLSKTYQGKYVADVETLKKLLKEQHGADVEVVSDVGPVIGAHSGPGTLALFFVGTEK
jgi:fatty acid-binding protein DegV